MKCFIYKSLNKNELYLYLDKKDSFSQLPDELLKSFGRLEFVMPLNLTLERQLARVDVSMVMADLKEKGFFVQMPPIIEPVLFANKKEQVV